MINKVFDRQKNTCADETVNGGALSFLYGNAFGRCVLKVLYSRFISRLAGRYMSGGISRRRIAPFIAENSIDMTQYIPREYSSFNDFFTREIDMKNRPLSQENSLLVSPADSRLSVFPIDGETCFSIKNGVYTVAELIGDNELARQYEGGMCLVFRLCVDDYHRYAFFDSGRLIKSWPIKGKLHTVNPIAFKRYRVFCENQRVVSLLETDSFGTAVQIEVGALMVGKIVNHDVTEFVRGQEKGMFKFGASTVVVLLKAGAAELDSDILQLSQDGHEIKIQLFETIGKKGKGGTIDGV